MGLGKVSLLERMGSCRRTTQQQRSCQADCENGVPRKLEVPPSPGCQLSKGSGQVGEVLWPQERGGRLSRFVGDLRRDVDRQMNWVGNGPSGHVEQPSPG